LHAPISYLITSGATDARTTPAGPDFARLLALVRAAAAARVTLVQLREQHLRPRVIFELTLRAAALVRGTETRLLVNDRADIARAAGADGVHLTTRSLPAPTVRRAFGPDFLVGVSTHTLAEAQAARAGGADFIVFGPVFDTPSKRVYGPPVGLAQLRAVAAALAPFPVVALGGITRANMASALAAGAHGVAAIRLFADPPALAPAVAALQEVHASL
jgi:thiamine-phosphate pyrophosphorylase